MLTFLYITPKQRRRRLERRLEQACNDLILAQLARINAEALIAAHSYEVNQLIQLLSQQEAANATPPKG